MSVKRGKKSETSSVKDDAEKKSSSKKTSSRNVEVFHTKASGEECHAWTITDIGHYQAWKSGVTPLRSAFVRMPDGKPPDIGTQVACGTCKDTRLAPTELIYRGPIEKDRIGFGKSQGTMRP